VHDSFAPTLPGVEYAELYRRATDRSVKVKPDVVRALLASRDDWECDVEMTGTGHFPWAFRTPTGLLLYRKAVDPNRTFFDIRRNGDIGYSVSCIANGPPPGFSVDRRVPATGLSCSPSEFISTWSVIHSEFLAQVFEHESPRRPELESIHFALRRKAKSHYIRTTREWWPGIVSHITWWSLEMFPDGVLKVGTTDKVADVKIKIGKRRPVSLMEAAYKWAILAGLGRTAAQAVRLHVGGETR